MRLRSESQKAVTTKMAQNSGGLFNRTATRHFLRKPPEQAHESALRHLRFLDKHPRLLAAVASRFPKESWPVEAGGVQLDNPLILAAGLVKGDGFTSEEEAMAAVGRRRNIIPGWRSVPAIAWAVEMGSFTPAPRLGNSGAVLWRDAEHRTLYNRVGLRNPGARAAAAFLGERQAELPAIYGISLAADPDETDLQQKCESIAAAVKHFISAGLRPSWVTVNLSCPNTDPSLQTANVPANQTITNPAIQTATEPPDHAETICNAVTQELPAEIPLWAKVGPDLPEAAYQELGQALAEAGAKAIVAVNTATRKVPQFNPNETQAGMGGASLRPEALRAVSVLAAATHPIDADTEPPSSTTQNLSLDIIGCGGIFNGSDLQAFQNAGAKAAQYWSALVFRGPNAATLIARESNESTRANRVVSSQ